eukprot:scaffold580484_cov15-Prasinocladus_malaysianus.AAC.1
MGIPEKCASKFKVQRISLGILWVHACDNSALLLYNYKQPPQPEALQAFYDNFDGPIFRLS